MATGDIFCKRLKTGSFPTTWYFSDIPTSNVGALGFPGYSGFYAKTVSVAADRYTLMSPNVIQVDISGVSCTLSTQVALDLSLAATWDTTSGTDYTVAANRAGKDFYVYCCQPTVGIAPKLLISANATYPSGYSGTTSRKVGGFHCLCVAAGTLTGHPMSGYLAGDIIPSSVWDLKFRCVSGNNSGLYFDFDSNTWQGIYLVSGSASAPTNVYGGTTLDNITWMDAVDVCRVMRMRLPRDCEFQSAAALSNEGTNINGSADPVTTGGHSDTAGRRMISKYGGEDYCGALWQWLDEQSYQVGTGVAGWYDHTGGKGQLYLPGGDNADVKLLAGGYWLSGACCGSRGRHASYFRWGADSYVGFRAVGASQTK